MYPFLLFEKLSCPPSREFFEDRRDRCPPLLHLPPICVRTPFQNLLVNSYSLVDLLLSSRFTFRDSGPVIISRVLTVLQTLQRTGMSAFYFFVVIISEPPPFKMTFCKLGHRALQLSPHH